MLGSYLVKVRVQEPRNELKLGRDGCFNPCGKDGLECLRFRVGWQRVLRGRVRTLWALDLGFEAKECRMTSGLFLLLLLTAGDGGGTSRDILESLVELSDFLREVLVKGVKGARGENQEGIGGGRLGGLTVFRLEVTRTITGGFKCTHKGTWGRGP
jgi:hypothetical protein